MVFLSDDEVKVLRIALGLDHTNKVYPSRNYLHPVYAEQHKDTVDELVKRGFMHWRTRDGESVYAATDAGRVAVIDAPWARTS